MLSRASNISIRELFENINPVDSEFLKYVPDGFLNNSQKEAKSKALKKERSKIDGLRFSLKDTSDVNTQEIEGQNKLFSRALGMAKNQFGLTQGMRVSDKRLEKMARHILSEYGSAYDAGALTANLRTMFDDMAGADNLEDIAQAGAGMAKAILEKSNRIDRQLYTYYEQARDFLRNTSISLTEKQLDVVIRAFGSSREFRRAMSGYVKLTSGGMYLDVAWPVLSAQYPELFDPRTGEADMPRVLMAAVEAMRPQYINEYGYSLNEGAYDLFLQICGKCFKAAEVRR